MRVFLQLIVGNGIEWRPGRRRQRERRVQSAVEKKSCQRPPRRLGRLFLSTGRGNRSLSAKNRPVPGTAVDKTSSLQVDGGWNVEHQVTSCLGHARQDPAFGLFFSRQAGPFDLISDLACEQFAHASPASAIPAGIRQPDAGAQA